MYTQVSWEIIEKIIEESDFEDSIRRLIVALAKTEENHKIYLSFSGYLAGILAANIIVNLLETPKDPSAREEGIDVVLHHFKKELTRTIEQNESENLH